jgi:anaerobic magnesium-protoporphyrin IX monomethyl ester cyclase
MKILLISTSTEINPLFNPGGETTRTTEDDVHYPLGLAYLYSVVENSGNKVKLLFLTKHTNEECYTEIKKTLEEFSPDVVGFQMQTFNRASTYHMMDYINGKYPKIKQVIGGFHATSMYQQILKKYPFVIAVLAEGEITFIELLKEFAKEIPDLHSVDGIAFNDKGNVIKTKQRELITDLDSIPFPKHELFFNGSRQKGSIITTRGCPFNCSFCCLNSVSRDRVRMRTVGNIIKEVEMMMNKFPRLDTIWIQDDTFFVDNQRVIKFCDEVIKRKLKINFACSGRMRPVSEEMVKKLEQANFKRIFFGLESGDNEILKKCHKGITQEDAVKTFKLFAKSSIEIFAHLIVGLPGENKDSIKETARFVKQLQKIRFIPNYYPGILIIFPGTEVYELAKVAGSIDDDYWLTDQTMPPYTTEHSFEELLQYREVLLDNFSLTRAFFTWRGFLAQFDIIPYNLKFIFSNKTNMRNFFIASLQFILPEKIYNFSKNFYRNKLKLRR